MDKSESIAVIRPSEKLEILYQDEFYLAVNKPSGLLVHRSPISRSEKRFALQIVRNQAVNRENMAADLVAYDLEGKAFFTSRDGASMNK